MMFGKTVDYYLLRPLTHTRNKADADELEHQAEQASRVSKDAPAHSPFTLEQARAYTNKVASLYFRGRFPVDPDLSYLDLGCGTGRLSVGLSLLGIRDVTGMDILARDIATANAIAETLPPDARPGFVHLDGQTPDPRTYDVVIALAVMEHVSSPRQFLERLRALLKPEGRAFVSMTPFHGPLGDHMGPFFRVQIPWRGVLFSEQAILRLRRERFRPSTPAQSFAEIEGGLNQMTVSEYLRNIRLAGLEVVTHNFDPHFYRYRRLWPLAPFSWALTRIPKVRDYFTFNVYSVLRRQDPGTAATDAQADRAPGP